MLSVVRLQEFPTDLSCLPLLPSPLIQPHWPSCSLHMQSCCHLKAFPPAVSSLCLDYSSLDTYHSCFARILQASAQCKCSQVAFSDHLGQPSSSPLSLYRSSLFELVLLNLLFFPSLPFTSFLFLSLSFSSLLFPPLPSPSFRSFLHLRTSLFFQ